MTVLHFSDALLPAGWARNVRLTITGGQLGRIETNVLPGPDDERHAIGLAGLCNLHSHAFQRGMAGLTERRGSGTDSFWSWREQMYRFALAMSPDDVETVAGQLYVEMLESGFTRVGEFHYLHHDKEGRPYSDPAEMAARIAAASVKTGIGLTLLPVFYAHSGFGAAAPLAEQRRFISSRDGFARLFMASARLIDTLDGANIGLAPHSLRAVSLDALPELLALASGRPMHIHVAEQVKEVEDCLANTGARPVQLLCDHVELSAQWCLIHATHMMDTELASVAASGAVVGLCPITEASLGDGIFPAAAFVEAGGRLGIGSDSNVAIGAANELAHLEYTQRLHLRQRNVLAAPDRSTGRTLFEAALTGGGRALGLQVCGLEVGAAADVVSLRADHPALISRQEDSLLDSWIFTAGNGAIDCVWARGRKLVSDGRHQARDDIARRFGATMRTLMTA